MCDWIQCIQICASGLCANENSLGQRLSDWLTNLKKHVLAPRARTQDQMNNWFQGTYYNLGERYTDLTKILFVVFVYSALFPAAFFFGAAILLAQYYVSVFLRFSSI